MIFIDINNNIDVNIDIIVNNYVILIMLIISIRK